MGGLAFGGSGKLEKINFTYKGEEYGETIRQGTVSGVQISGTQGGSQRAAQREHYQAGKDDNGPDSAEAWNQKDHAGRSGVLGTCRGAHRRGGGNRLENGSAKAKDPCGDGKADRASGKGTGDKAAENVRERHSGI